MSPVVAIVILVFVGSLLARLLTDDGSIGIKDKKKDKEEHDKKAPH
ncbi:hypothetical protein J6X15_00015 [Candidatus Saccharibacteria bacterium]|nr:hypothetical protein [Candidatus Saccharibacteria bacterium]MBP5655963.1 hypothetical protein [Candidatus Saccharibacteria bacterium]